jgi:hypothetical protein
LTRLRVKYSKELERLKGSSQTPSSPLSTPRRNSDNKRNTNTTPIDPTTTPTNVPFNKEGYFVSFFHELYNNEKYFVVHEMVKSNKFDELEKYIETNPEALQYTDEKVRFHSSFLLINNKNNQLIENSKRTQLWDL